MGNNESNNFNEEKFKGTDFKENVLRLPKTFLFTDQNGIIKEYNFLEESTPSIDMIANFFPKTYLEILKWLEEGFGYIRYGDYIQNVSNNPLIFDYVPIPKRIPESDISVYNLPLGKITQRKFTDVKESMLKTYYVFVYMSKENDKFPVFEEELKSKQKALEDKYKEQNLPLEERYARLMSNK
jgi:hypothetical protein